MPMCAALSDRRVVDAVAGHGHDFAVRLERVDDAQLLLRHDPREHGRGSHALCQIRVAQLLELFARHEVFGVEPRLTGDGSGRRRIVAGDHDHLDASRPAFAHGIGHARPQRIGKADQTQELEREIVLRVRPRLPGERGAGDAQHAQALRGHLVHRLRQRRAIGAVEAAKIGDRFRRALGRDDELLPAIGCLPDVRHGEEIGPKPVGVDEVPFGAMQMLGLGQLLAAKIMKRLLHRVEGISRTGEHAELDQVMELLRHFPPGGVARPKRFAALEPQLGDRHPVLGQRAGLVRAQHRRRAERFDGGGAPGQHARPRDAPGAHRHEDGEDDRKLFGQHRHAERDAAQHARRAIRRARCRRAAPPGRSPPRRPWRTPARAGGFAPAAAAARFPAC